MSGNGQTKLGFDGEVLSNITPGRRQRPSASNSMEMDRLKEAKENFSAALKKALDVLKNCGYSHERASAALLRELSRGDFPAPRDEQIFETMQRYGVGIDEAVKVLTVAHALERDISEGGISDIKAVENLTSKLSAVNLIAIESDSSASGPGSDSEEVAIRPRSPDLRIKPVARRTLSHSRSKSIVAKKGKNSRLSKHKSKASSTPVKSGSVTRKRSFDDSNQSDKRESSSRSSRGRADSISEVVQSKIAGNVASDDGAPLEGSQKKTVSSLPSVRSKRSRVEDPEIGVSKRQRASETIP